MAPPARHAFDCALVSTLETYDDPENGNNAPCLVYIYYGYYVYYTH